MGGRSGPGIAAVTPESGPFIRCANAGICFRVSRGGSSSGRKLWINNIPLQGSKVYMREIFASSPRAPAGRSQTAKGRVCRERGSSVKFERAYIPLFYCLVLRTNGVNRLRALSGAVVPCATIPYYLLEVGHIGGFGTG